MKVVTANNGRKAIKISRNEWEEIGEKSGWSKITKPPKPPEPKKNDVVRDAYEKACILGGFQIIKSDNPYATETIWRLVFTAHDGYRVVESFKKEFVAREVVKQINSIKSVSGVENYLQKIRDNGLGDSLLANLRSLKETTEEQPSKPRTSLDLTNPKHVAILALIQRSGFDNKYSNDLNDNTITLNNRETGYDVCIEWENGAKIKKAHLTTSNNNVVPLFSKTVENLILELRKIVMEYMKKQK